MCDKKDKLLMLITIEMDKLLAESVGEIELSAARMSNPC